MPLTIPSRPACYIGIDPGVRGALVVLAYNRTVLTSCNTPLLNVTSSGKGYYDLHGMLRLLRDTFEYGDPYCHIEKSQSMPRDSRPSAWKTGCGFGYWEMALTACEIPYSVIGPRVWQKTMHKNLPASDNKTKSILAAQRMLPELNLLKSARSRKPDHNIADAGLLALHCLRTNTNIGES